MLYGRLSYAIGGRNGAGEWRLRYNRAGSEAEKVLVLDRRQSLGERVRALFGLTSVADEHRELYIPFDAVSGAKEGGEGFARRFSFY